MFFGGSPHYKIITTRRFKHGKRKNALNSRGGGGSSLTPEMFGCTKMAIDKSVYTSDTYVTNITFNHSLSVKPRVAILIGNLEYRPSTYAAWVSIAFAVVDDSGNTRTTFLLGSKDTIGNKTCAQSSYTGTASASTITFYGTASSNEVIRADVEYTLITMA